LLEAGTVGLGLGANQQINWRYPWQQLRSDNFTQPAFNAVSLHDFPPMFGNHDSNPWMRQQGSSCSSLETLGLHALPCTPYHFKLGFIRQPEAATEAKSLMRRRISSATGRSTASVPSSGAG
jgi:hypothetical protein